MPMVRANEENGAAKRLQPFDVEHTRAIDAKSVGVQTMDCFILVIVDLAKSS